MKLASIGDISYDNICATLLDIWIIGQTKNLSVTTNIIKEK